MSQALARMAATALAVVERRARSLVERLERSTLPASRTSIVLHVEHLTIQCAPPATSSSVAPAEWAAVELLDQIRPLLRHVVDPGSINELWGSDAAARSLPPEARARAEALRLEYERAGVGAWQRPRDDE